METQQVVERRPEAQQRARRLSPDARRASILDAATQLLAERGPTFSTLDLARAAGVSEATIFRYFPDKASLVEATREQLLGLDTLLPRLAAARDLPTLPQRLAAAAHAVNPRLERTARTLTNLEYRHPDGSDAITQLLAALTPLFDGVEAGLDAEQLAGVFLGALLGNMVLSAGGGAESVDTDRLVDVVLHGVLGHDHS